MSLLGITIPLRSTRAQIPDYCGLSYGGSAVLHIFFLVGAGRLGLEGALLQLTRGVFWGLVSNFSVLPAFRILFLLFSFLLPRQQLPFLFHHPQLFLISLDI